MFINRDSLSHPLDSPDILAPDIKKTLFFPSKPHALYRDYWNPSEESGLKHTNIEITTESICHERRSDHAADCSNQRRMNHYHHENPSR
jgi:hypothetical protein